MNLKNTKINHNAFSEEAVSGITGSFRLKCSNRFHTGLRSRFRRLYDFSPDSTTRPLVSARNG